MATVETTPELAADRKALAYGEGMAAGNAYIGTMHGTTEQHCPYPPGSDLADWFDAGWADAYTRWRTGNLARLRAQTTGRPLPGGEK